jgi:ribosomal protein S12 methylthiotransferase
MRVVLGCAAALDDQRPVPIQLRGLPTVERVVGGADLLAIASALDLPLNVSTLRTRHQTGTRALLRVQDGCDEHCTFCATTLARGANRSRLVEEIIREASVLGERHAEIVITGIHIGTYGVDNGSSLGALMQRLVVAVPKVRFRLSSIEATEIDDALVELLSDDARRVAPHVHAPLQSGSDRLLRRMGRHWYTAATYANGVERLSARCKVLGLGADVIAGFPGETEAEFEHLLDFMREARIDRAGCFAYSPVDGAAANALPGALPEEVKEERRRRFMTAQAAISARRLRAQVGRIIDVLVDSIDGSRALARGTGDAPEIDGVVSVIDGAALEVGDFARVTVIESDQHDLVARLARNDGVQGLKY